MTRQEWIVLGIAAFIVGGFAMVYFKPFPVGRRTHPPHSPPSRVLLGNLSTAVALFEIDMGRLPSRLSELVESNGSERWSGPYIKGAIPNDPWGNPVKYTVIGETQYELRCSGPDGILGTEDDIVKSTQQTAAPVPSAPQPGPSEGAR